MGHHNICVDPICTTTDIKKINNAVTDSFSDSRLETECENESVPCWHTESSRMKGSCMVLPGK